MIAATAVREPERVHPIVGLLAHDDLALSAIDRCPVCDAWTYGGVRVRGSDRTVALCGECWDRAAGVGR